jgi:HAD superfamily hydrolase (TIGR01509 family)
VSKAGGTGPKLILYDFDGVVADSETICNVVLAEMLSEAGLPTTLEDALTLYCGRRWVDCLKHAEERLGRSLPAEFGKQREAEALRRLSCDLEAVPGATAFIDAFAHVPRCIASSSSPSYIDVCLNKLGLADRFGAHVFSAAVHVRRGKPHPDIFLYAAEQFGARPSSCVVIEDSGHGVEAGVAAGMTVIGLCAASHVRAGHDERLRAAGAHHVASNFEAAAGIVRVL